MISNRTIIEFGSGSTAMSAGLNDGGDGLFCMRGAEPGPVGREIDDQTSNLLRTDPEAVLYFTSVEALDNVINHLIVLKDAMVDAKKEKQNDQN